MKKIYSLLAAACISVSALAATPGLKVSDLRMAPGVRTEFTKAELMKSEHIALPGENGMQKIIDKNTNQEWASLLCNMGPWELVYNDGRKCPFEEMPFYQVVVAFQAYETSAFFQNMLMWPAYGALNQECWVTNGETQALDMEKVAQIYGAKKVKQPMSYEDYIAECTEFNLSPRLYSIPGFAPYPCIVGAEVTGSKSTLPDGTECYSCSATVNQDNTLNVTPATYIDWNGFDAETSEYKMVFDGKFSKEKGGSQAYVFNGDFQGQGVVLGFANINWDTVGEVHIFNGGRQEYMNDWSLNYEQFNTPLNYYFLAFCDASTSYVAMNQQGETIYAYSDDTLPQPSASSMIGSSYNFESTDHFVWFSGALWAPENAEFPYGTWEMYVPKDGEVTVDAQGNATLDMSPEAYKLIPGAYKSTFGAQDGFHGIYEGYTNYAMTGSKVGIGDKKFGLNFVLRTNFTGENFIYGAFTDDIILHNTPEQWMTTTSLPAQTNGSYDVVTEALDTAVDTVIEESNAPVVSRSFYNFQGQRLNSEPESGMYIIRAVKADGTVKATKVAK